MAVQNQVRLCRCADVPRHHCICKLAHIISSAHRIQRKLDLSTIKTIGVYQRVPLNSTATSFGTFKHGIAIENGFITVVREQSAFGHYQIMSQGSQIVLDGCAYAWNGMDAAPLESSDYAKLLDFYERSCVTGYCTVIATGANGSTLSERMSYRYIDLSPFHPRDAVSHDHVNTHLPQALSVMNLCDENARKDAVQLIEQLDNAYVRFTFFSTENELRTRMFAVQLGLEAGWNCHVSLACEGICISNRAICLSSVPLLGSDQWQIQQQFKRCTGHDKLSYLDLALNKRLSNHYSYFTGTSNLISRSQSLIELSTSPVSNRRSSTNKAIVHDAAHQSNVGEDIINKSIISSLKEEVSLSSSSNNLSPQLPPLLPNVAGLPSGIENIRSHLKTVDNVPLLVNLFTDCDYKTDAEMIKVMKEYGETVLVVGSALNADNTNTFNQADCSICIEPQYPSVCCDKPSAPSELVSETATNASTLMHIATNILFVANQVKVDMLSMITESRRRVRLTRSAILFFLHSSIAVAITQLFSLLIFMPPLFSAFQVVSNYIISPSDRDDPLSGEDINDAAVFTSGAGLTSEQFMKKPQNEPILTYKRGSDERLALDKALEQLSTKITDVPLRIGREKITNNFEKKQVMPSDHQTTIARFTYASKEQIQHAIETSLIARESWRMKSLKDRADILLHAADLVSGKYRMLLNAATMLGQGKSIVQAEIDSACELADFLRFNSMFALELERYKPISSNTVTNTMLMRGLEGFVAAIAPFNFTAIGGNLPTAPALMVLDSLIIERLKLQGNVSLWKPSDTAVLSNYLVYELLEEAGMPPGVISFLPSDGPVFGDTVTASPHFSALNFTGSVPTFKYLWRKVAENLDKYVTFPKLVGECGGKNFHFVHPSADVDSVAIGTIRSAFEYQGQKCSACSRIFIPDSLWESLKDKLIEIQKQIKVRDGSIFMSAVIDAKAFKRITSYIDHAKKGNDGAQIIFGGDYDSSKGYFIQPTMIKVNDWNSKLLTEEIFGPVLTAYVYPDSDAMNVVKKVKDATPYGLTGAVFAEDREFLYKARDVLRDAVGNMYLNDKSTGSVVGQQPFGGARMSGTNDKAGGPHYALRWSSPLVIKETREPLSEWRYPSMD
ncbi:unnamed protein product [Anisakis simplex]|uniref:Delta-1-pyrroline-5-carboxylate dehydrogenase, mitochondrial n=1 Tax=Anisakis simplex TaxID=6269 RepID=A0A0M3JRD3_ANISI|nr:unnamed protein product [Anisakis simplex]